MPSAPFSPRCRWVSSAATRSTTGCCAAWVECPAALLFLVGTLYGRLGLGSTLVRVFIVLSSLGLACPNATALALAPWERNIGSASAHPGLLQIGVSGLASAPWCR